VRGVVLLGNRVAELRDFVKPVPRAGEILIRVKAAGICGSDLHFYRSKPEELGPRVGVIVGHEPAGVVDKVGSGVRYFAVGDRVTVSHSLGCGHCEFCLAGNAAHCSDYVGMGAAGRGGDAEFVAMPERNGYLLPPELTFKEGSMLACTAATAYGALRKLSPSGRQNLAVFGAGPVGLSAVMIGHALGARVIAVDVLQERLDLAERMGASEIVNAAFDDAVDAIRSLTHGRGAELVLETSGNPTAQDQVIEACCVHGKVAYVGRGGGGPSVDPERVIWKEATLIGSLVLSANLYWEMIRFMLDQDLRFEPLVTHSVPLEDAPWAFREFDGGAAGKFILTPGLVF